MKKIMFNDRYGLTEAVLSGRKTQTRRILPAGTPLGSWRETERKSKYKTGEIVAIAQSYKDAGYDSNMLQTATINGNIGDYPISQLPGWKNKMFTYPSMMPHHIRITNVRVERLQDISEEDCIKEGIYPYYYGDEKEKIECGFYPDGFSFDGIDCHYPTSCEAYAALIDRISGKGAWESNPYVFVYDFELDD